MRLGGDDDRSNVEDRRGLITGGRLGIGGILLLGVLSIVFRQNFFALVGDNGTATQAQGPQADQRRQDEASLEKVAVGSFNDTQRFWGQNLRGYRDAKLVLFWDETQSGCGGAAAEMGPFYCPPDERVYIDLGFYRELARRFGAPGDFAQAYANALAGSRRVSTAVPRRPATRWSSEVPVGTFPTNAYRTPVMAVIDGAMRQLTMDFALPCSPSYARRVALSGNLSETSFTDLVQFYSISRQTAAVTIVSPAGPEHDGSVCLEEGEIVGARFGQVTGLDAVRR